MWYFCAHLRRGVAECKPCTLKSFNLNAFLMAFLISASLLQKQTYLRNQYQGHSWSFMIRLHDLHSLTHDAGLDVTPSYKIVVEKYILQFLSGNLWERSCRRSCRQLPLGCLCLKFMFLHCCKVYEGIWRVYENFIYVDCRIIWNWCNPFICAEYMKSFRSCVWTFDRFPMIFSYNLEMVFWYTNFI